MVLTFKRANDRPVVAIAPSGWVKYWDNQTDCAMSCESIDCSSERIRKYLNKECRPRGRFADWDFLPVDKITIEGNLLIIDGMTFKKCTYEERTLTVRRVTRLRERITPLFINVYYRRIPNDSI